MGRKIKYTHTLHIYNWCFRFLDSDNDPTRSQPSYPGVGRSWFKCYLLLGLIAFVIFWLVLMLRVYLHEKYWTWSYIW